MDALEAHLNLQAQRSEAFFWNRLRWELVESQLPPAGRFEVVDVGAGPGFLGDFLKRRLPLAEYRFIEPIESLERELESRFGEDANRRRASSFAASGFATLLDVLEHQENDREFMADLAGKMEPGSALLLTVPAMPSLWSEWDVALGHFQRYTKASLQQAIAELPFETVESSYIFPELIPLAWVRKLRAPATAGSAEDGSAEFPDLASPLNESLYRLGRQSLKGRRRWRAGTSLFARLHRR